MAERSSGPPTRPSLLQRLRDPADRKAAELFGELYIPAIWRSAQRIGLQGAELEEVTQNVWVQILKRMRKGTFEYYPEKGRFRSYLFTAICNEAKRLRKREKRRTQVEKQEPSEMPLEEMVSLELESEFEDIRRERLLEVAMEHVKKSYKLRTWQVFLEGEVKGRPVEEVAAEFGMSVGAVHTCVCRVRQRLREEVLFLNTDCPFSSL